ELRGDGGDLLLDVAEEFLPLGIRSVGGIEQARVRDDAAEEVVELLELAHGLGKRIAALAAVEQARELAGVALLHGVGRAFRGGEIVLELGRVRAAIEVGQVPLRQAPELALSRLLSNARAL